MMTFYLNDCICEAITGCSEEKLIESFSSFILSYVHYTRSDNRENYRLILKCDPQIFKVGGKSVSELVRMIPRDIEHESMRKKAYSMFNNYPVNQYIECKRTWEDSEWQDYVFLKQDANNLFIAYKEGWCIASIPIIAEVMVSPITVIGKQDSKNVNINNWYAKNSYEIKQIEYAGLEETEQIIKILPYYFEEKQVTFSNEFESQFKDPNCAVRSNVVNRLLDAYKSDLLFPAKADDNIVKKCDGEENEGTYELRQKGSGMRVYFYCDDQRLILASLHTKAEYASKADQTRDICHASKIIGEILS